MLVSANWAWCSAADDGSGRLPGQVYHQTHSKPLQTTPPSEKTFPAAWRYTRSDRAPPLYYDLLVPPFFSEVEWFGVGGVSHLGETTPAAGVAGGVGVEWRCVDATLARNAYLARFLLSIARRVPTPVPLHLPTPAAGVGEPRGYLLSGHSPRFCCTAPSIFARRRSLPISWCRYRGWHAL